MKNLKYNLARAPKRGFIHATENGKKVTFCGAVSAYWAGAVLSPIKNSKRFVLNEEEALEHVSCKRCHRKIKALSKI